MLTLLHNHQILLTVDSFLTRKQCIHFSSSCPFTQKHVNMSILSKKAREQVKHAQKLYFVHWQIMFKFWQPLTTFLPFACFHYPQSINHCIQFYCFQSENNFLYCRGSFKHEFYKKPSKVLETCLENIEIAKRKIHTHVATFNHFTFRDKYHQLIQEVKELRDLYQLYLTGPPPMKMVFERINNVRQEKKHYFLLAKIKEIKLINKIFWSINSRTKKLVM